MAIMFNKGQNFGVLQSFSVPNTTIDTLKKMGATFKLGNNSIGLVCGEYSKELTFTGLGLNNALKSAATALDKAKVIAFVAEFINAVGVKSTLDIPVVAAPTTLDEVNQLPMCKLREATKMYQRVYGTSGGSVYRLVAFNDKIKVAVRVQDTNVSIRVEGTLTNNIVKAFSSLGVTKKSDEYMSGHFGCNNCTVDKLIGSVLTGSGIEFTSPIPHISKVVD